MTDDADRVLRDTAERARDLMQAAMKDPAVFSDPALYQAKQDVISHATPLTILRILNERDAAQDRTAALEAALRDIATGDLSVLPSERARAVLGGHDADPA